MLKTDEQGCSLLPTQFVSLEQGTEDWLFWRKNRVTASESPIIMGLSPYSTPYRLWLEKTGRLKSKFNANMAYGHKMETIIRNDFEVSSGDLFKPCVVQHPTIPILGSSLDGLSLGGDVILEIKCCSKEVFDGVELGEVPPFHYYQVQHQLSCVPSAKKAFLHYYHAGKTSTVTVLPEWGDIKEIYIKAAEFFDLILSDTPPPVEDKDFILLKDQEAVEAARKFKEAKIKYDYAKSMLDEAKKELIDFTDNGNALIDGVKISWIYSKRADYKKACEESNINLDEYMKESVSPRVTIEKES